MAFGSPADSYNQSQGSLHIKFRVMALPSASLPPPPGKERPCHYQQQEPIPPNHQMPV